MTRPKKRLSIGLVAIYHFLIWAVVPGCLGAAPLLWRVEGSRPSFFFGTIHSADPEVEAIDPIVLQALDRCQSFHPEVALSSDLPARMAARMFDPSTPALSGALAPALWSRVVAAGAKWGLPPELLQRLSPGLAALLFATPPGTTDIMATVDGQLYRRSQSRGLIIAPLETVEDQLALFDRLGKPEAVALLNQSLVDFEAGRPQFSRLLAAYAAGDEARIAEAVADEFKDPAVQALAEPLLYRRNRAMAAKIAPFLRRGAAFVAVGAAHLVGPRSVIAILRAQGFRISRVP